MILSLFLARFLGLFLIILCSAIIANRKRIYEIAQNFNPALIIVSGFINIILGLLLVLIHNIWTSDWRVIITLLAWLTLAKGMFRLFAPYKVMAFAIKFTHPKIILCASSLFLLIGIYLTYIGFTPIP